MQKNEAKKAKILFLFIIVILGLVVFLFTLFYWVNTARRIPSKMHKEVIYATRGDIISSDGIKVTTSKTYYKVSIDTRSIDPDKKDLFIKLYSIYTNEPQTKIRNILNKRQGYVVLSYKISAKTAQYLRSLSKVMFRLKVFKEYRTKSGKLLLSALSVTRSGKGRVFHSNDTLSPVLGYIKKIEDGKITRVKGMKGLERFYDNQLAPIQNLV